ncbi:Regulator of nucleoside diphosphate kinase [Salinivirga cyanobacteriivorans]|uniref:Regulator of nucleoside diphosphate kinase n=1 Tax=Salinivirga cyanobacteriivorans TaxID=1307839 RepID=A0A0S2I109_9BACT|nr:GreA/GreB family elongation factor [Salinivirga cyanobacteriivorans]ALO15983.1 Regulator of nucleoside diphosphate kinase [Salinivirga cyanobacteriivorans]
MKNIKITELDYARLKKAILHAREKYEADVNNLDNLAFEIRRAEKLDSKKIPPNVITMNSKVKLLNKKSKKETTIKIVYPKEANFKNGSVSILSPLGIALLGNEAGKEVSFNAPSGNIQMIIQEIEYQPESNGDYLV